jgi:spore coat protein U-like protein
MMIGPNSSLLGYSLRSNTGGSVNWGHTVGVDTVSGTGSGSVQTLSVLGQISAGQSVQNGPYADTITVTVTY